MSEPCVVISCAAGSRENADEIAAALIDGRLAACVQIAPIDSVFRWNGALERAAEFALTIHTTAARAAAAVACIERLHTYEVPGISTVAVTGGAAGYLAWIAESVAPD